jgi:nicotinamidase-related amidase
MSHDSRSGLLSAEQSQLVVIDVQEKLLPAICHQHNLISAIRFLMDAAAILKVSAIVTEQYSKAWADSGTSSQSSRHCQNARKTEVQRCRSFDD